MKVAGIVLAAGSGSRFGGPKALVRFGDELLVERACRLLTEGGCDPLLAVLGAAHELVRARAALPPLTVLNPDWPTGIGSSVRAGLAAVPAEVGAAVVALADEPLVGAESVRRLLAAHRDGLPPGVRAVVATYAGQQRNPVLLTRDVFAAVAAAATGDRGARVWLRSHPDQVIGVPCDDTGDALDVDTPDDLAQALARAGRGARPPGAADGAGR
jgi:CTP:molybdopterin cytidylyltransferase MocA